MSAIEIAENSIIVLLITLGLFFITVTAIGLFRLPDVYSRTHAASKSATLGVMFILLGVFFYFFFFKDVMHTRILLGIVFLFMTGPVGGHVIGRAAYLSGERLWKHSVRDDLKSAVTQQKKEI